MRVDRVPPRPPPVLPPSPPGALFRAAIEKAVADGISPSGLLLQLTRRDASKLKRDRSIAIADISFADGEMRYLGVRVTEDDVASSALIIAES
jgi:hypothetical protein